MFSLRNFNNLSNITALKGSKRNENDILAFALVIHKLSHCYPYNEIRDQELPQYHQVYHQVSSSFTIRIFTNFRVYWYSNGNQKLSTCFHPLDKEFYVSDSLPGKSYNYTNYHQTT